MTTPQNTIADAQQLIDSLYANGDLSHDQANPILDVLDQMRRLEQSHHDAWKLLGRCDMAFELISTNRSLATAKRTARQLRDEIKKASGQ